MFDMLSQVVHGDEILPVCAPTIPRRSLASSSTFSCKEELLTFRRLSCVTPRQQDECKVKVVAAVSGHEVALQCQKTLAVQDVKREVDRLWDIPVRQQQLVAGEIVAHNDVEICSLGISGEVMLSLVRVDIPDFQEGDRVIAVKDSPHSLWQKAGDQGTVIEVDAYGGVVVFWDMHHATTPFGPDILGADPFEVLRIARTRARALRVGDLVVATANGGDAASSYFAGNECIVTSS